MRRRKRQAAADDDTALRQKLGEIAGQVLENRLASWAFIGWQTFISIAWVVWNTLGPAVWRFDAYPFVFGNLGMSAEASFSTPILLIAGKVQQRKTDAQLRHLQEELATVKGQLSTAIEALARMEAKLNQQGAP